MLRPPRGSPFFLSLFFHECQAAAGTPFSCARSPSAATASNVGMDGEAKPSYWEERQSSWEGPSAHGTRLPAARRRRRRGHARQRNGLCPDFKLRLPSADGPRDTLGELKFISAGVSRYPIGSRRKAVDVRAAELPGAYRRPLQRLDTQHHGTREGETGPLVRRLESYGVLECYVAGAWGEGSGPADGRAGPGGAAAMASRLDGLKMIELRATTLYFRYLTIKCWRETILPTWDGSGMVHNMII